MILEICGRRFPSNLLSCRLRKRADNQQRAPTLRLHLNPLEFNAKNLSKLVRCRPIGIPAQMQLVVSVFAGRAASCNAAHIHECWGACLTSCPWATFKASTQVLGALLKLIQIAKQVAPFLIQLPQLYTQNCVRARESGQVVSSVQYRCEFVLTAFCYCEPCHDSA